MFSLILAPTLKYMLFYAIVFYTYEVQTVYRHMHGEERAKWLVNWLLVTFGIFFFWFIFQKRELKRFRQMSEAEEKEKEAIDESNQFTNVLNLQQDAIIIYSFEDELRFYDDSASTRANQSQIDRMSIEFSNQKVTDLFSIDLCKAMKEPETHQRTLAHEILAQPSLIQMKDPQETSQNHLNFNIQLSKLKKMVEIETEMNNE